MEQLYKAELDPYLLVPEAHFSNLVLSSAADLISLRGAGGGGESDLTLKRRFPSIRYPTRTFGPWATFISTGQSPVMIALVI